MNTCSSVHRRGLLAALAAALPAPALAQARPPLALSTVGMVGDMVRGIDRNSEDRKPKNLTKKLNRKSRAKATAGGGGGDEAPAEDAKKK